MTTRQHDYRKTDLQDGMLFRNAALPAFPVGATLCSGIGAPEVAAPWIDWRFASETEPFPRAVLQTRFGYQPAGDHNQGEPLLWGDMAEVTPDLLKSRGVPLPDILVAGTPCQAFSLAGSRGGLADARGNLTLKYVELCHAIQDASPAGRLFTIWENVPGVLSMRDNAFGCLLGGIVGARPIDRPDGLSWPRAGLVAGPRGRAAWRVLDAQFFGLAQRRKRVFLVASLGDGPDPAEILFERESGIRHSAPRRNPGPENARPAAGGAGGNGGPAGRVITSSGDLSYCLNAGGMGRCDLESETLVVSPVFTIQERAVCENPNAGPDGAGFSARGLAYTLEARSQVQAVSFQPGNHGRGSSDQDPHIAFTVAESDQLYCVRRLTPAECHVLQGFPLDHCAIEYRGKPAADGAQYKALGNSMAVPVMRWLLDRARGVSSPLIPYDYNAAIAAKWSEHEHSI